MLVKICGISNSIDAETAIEMGANAIGFVMGGKCLPVEVEPHAQKVRDIIKTFPKNVDSFVVTHLLHAEDIIDLADYVKATGIQISEELDVSVVKAVRNNVNKKIIKTVVARDIHSITVLQNYEPYADFILLDTERAGYVGGTGQTSDWQLCKQLVEAAKKPVYLAGGLTPDNVVQGITAVRPAGVDVSTGISTYSEQYLKKDRKCPKKINSFITQVRTLQNA